MFPSPCIHSLFPNIHPPTHPAHPRPVLTSEELWINVSALAARGPVSGGVWDRRASLVHAPLALVNGARAGVDSGSLCAAQWPVTATTDRSFAPRTQTRREPEREKTRRGELGVPQGARSGLPVEAVPIQRAHVNGLATPLRTDAPGARLVSPFPIVAVPERNGILERVPFPELLLHPLLAVRLALFSRVFLALYGRGAQIPISVSGLAVGAVAFPGTVAVAFPGTVAVAFPGTVAVFIRTVVVARWPPLVVVSPSGLLFAIIPRILVHWRWPRPTYMHHHVAVYRHGATGTWNRVTWVWHHDVSGRNNSICRISNLLLLELQLV
ncbi:hypothetical protein EYF80_022031 [Liparis tanakae]|uniref:Uncharacterized protein n=1 Tax=Liparis tanakae TaxID=230148 RepID=A0A4Z2HQY3_9TELE|nr:hypothetical protein EYF80_022031 [Liparis tanakae]